MSTQVPPSAPIADAVARLRADGRVVLAPDATRALLDVAPAALDRLAASWSDLPHDEHLKDHGRYRRRRHACYVIEGDALARAPHRAHWQPLEYNALHGGMRRWFAPVSDAIDGDAAWTRTIAAFGTVFSQVRPVARWYVEAHQFRIDTAGANGGIGRPTPEGAHRDGVDFVVVTLVARRGVKGGETRVFDADGPAGQRFTMTEPWTALLLDDARVIHETTPIQPVDPSAPGVRDTLVLTYRAAGFQGDD